MYKRNVKYKGKNYVLTFDEEGMLDTVVFADKPAELLVSTRSDVRCFVKSQEAIFNCNPPNGIQVL